MRRPPLLLWQPPGHAARPRQRIRHLQPQMVKALRLFRAAGKLGAPGALPAPPELLPAGARVLAQGYLNRFSLPLLTGWLLPRWMRAQADPSSPTFTPRSVINLMVNQTARNWTALGIPGTGHAVESLVDGRGLLTPVPGGPSLDWWADVKGSGLGIMAAGTQVEVSQRLQDDLPVVLTAFEAGGLRVSSEAWMLSAPDGDWAAMQVVLFNIADLKLTGTFYFALRPYNPEGISPVYNVEWDGLTLRADGRDGPVTWPKPEGHALGGIRTGDLFRNMQAAQVEQEFSDPQGFAHGVLRYSFAIEPWEEAEFLAFWPLRSNKQRQKGIARAIFTAPSLHVNVPDPLFYSKAKVATTIEWRRILDSGMTVSVPHRTLQSAWEANRAHLLALHDGDEITPGPDLYHSFWFRDGAYMVYALSLCGFKEEAAQLLKGFSRRQRRDGALISHMGEWDSTGQALWAIGRHLRLYRDAQLGEELRICVTRAAAWLCRTLEASPDGLMPPGVSAEHLGPADRYYWDNLWSLAGLREARAILGRNSTLSRAESKLRHTLLGAWRGDRETLRRNAIPAAPGRGLDIGVVGSLAAWFPLRLLPASNPLLEGTLAALEEIAFHEGALFVQAGHSGWGTYLNMRVAGCRLMQGSERGWHLMRKLLDMASPTLNWPEAVHPQGGGSAGDGHHGWASAEWLMLVRALLLEERGNDLVITPFLPAEWLQNPGEIAIAGAPTLFGPVAFKAEWSAGGKSLRLNLEANWRGEPPKILWKVPGKIVEAETDGRRANRSRIELSLPDGAISTSVIRK